MYLLPREQRCDDISSWGDFVSSGSLEDLKRLQGGLKHGCNIKTITIGEDEKLAKSVRILNRIVRWHPGEGVIIEADPRHVEIAIVDAGAGSAKTLSPTG